MVSHVMRVFYGLFRNCEREKERERDNDIALRRTFVTKSSKAHN